MTAKFSPQWTETAASFMDSFGKRAEVIKEITFLVSLDKQSSHLFCFRSPNNSALKADSKGGLPLPDNTGFKITTFCISPHPRAAAMCLKI